MDLFQQSGEAMLLAQDGQRQLAFAIAATVRRWLVSLKAWHGAMPITLPPTEPQHR